MITVFFFAQTRELVGVDSVEVDATYSTIEEIRSDLSTREGKWDIALEEGKLLSALNQSIVPLTTEVKDGDEVAFFPPVTGG